MNNSTQHADPFMLQGVVLPPSPNWYSSSIADRSHCGSCVAFAAHNLVVLLGVQRHAVTGILTGHSNRVTALAFATSSPSAPEGSTLLLSAAADRSVRLWQLSLQPSENDGQSGEVHCSSDSPRCIQVVRNLSAPVTAMAVSSNHQSDMSSAAPAGMAWLGDSKGNVLIWILDSSTKPTKLFCLESAINSMAAIPAQSNTHVAAGCADGSIHVCCGETGSRVWAAQGAHKGEVQSLVWLLWPGPSAEEHGDEVEGTATEQKVLNEGAPVTPGDDGEEKAEATTVSSGPRSSSSAGWLASSGPDNVARVWGAEGGAPLHSLWMPKADAGSHGKGKVFVALEWAGISQDQRCAWLLSSAAGGSLILWEIPATPAEVAGPSGARTVAVPTPCYAKLPKIHGRLVFSLTALPPMECVRGHRSLEFVSTSMDRSVNLWRLELPPPPRNPREASSLGNAKGNCDRNSPVDEEESGGTNSNIAATDAVLKDAVVAVDDDGARDPVHAGPSGICGSIGAAQMSAVPSVDTKGNHEDNKKKIQQLLQAAAKGASVTWGLQGLGGHVYQAAVGRPFAAGAKGTMVEPLGLGCGDSTIRLWLEGSDCTTTSSPGRQSLLWKGIPAKVLVVSWHPTVPCVLAWGAEDGTVGLVDFSSKGNKDQHACTGAISVWSQRHKGPVVDLSWHPAVEWAACEAQEEAREAANREIGAVEQDLGPLLRLWSVGAEGQLLEWPPLRRGTLTTARPSGSKGGGANSIPALPGVPVPALLGEEYGRRGAGSAAWSSSSLSPGGAVLAIGCTQGTVSLFQRRRRQETDMPQATDGAAWLWVPACLPLLRHSKAVSRVRWAPGDRLLATAGDDGCVSLLEWQGPTAPEGDGAGPLSTGCSSLVPLSTIGNLKGPVNDIDWAAADAPMTGQQQCCTGVDDIISSRSFRLAAACSDSVVRCWAVRCPFPSHSEGSPSLDPVLVAELKGHAGRVMTVAFSSDGQRLFSGGEDQTLRFWMPDRISAATLSWQQEQPKEEPPNSRSVGGGKESPLGHVAGLHSSPSPSEPLQPQPDEQHQTPTVTAAAGLEETGASSCNGTDSKAGASKASSSAETRDNDVAGSARTEEKEESFSLQHHHQQQQQQEEEVQQQQQQQQPAAVKRQRQRGKPTLGARALLEDSAAADAADEQALALFRKECLALVGDPGTETGTVTPPDLEPENHHAVWRSPQEASRALQVEAERIRPPPGDAPSAASTLRAVQRSATLQLWRGDVAGAVATLLDHEDGAALTGDWVNMAAAAGREAWVAVTRAYAARQEAAGEIHNAALQLAAIGDIRAAVQVYRRAGLLSEALALGCARLMPGDPLLDELHGLKATALEGKGVWEEAACHHAAAGDPHQAAVCLTQRGGAQAVMAAAEVAKAGLGKLQLLHQASECTEGGSLAAGQAGAGASMMAQSRALSDDERTAAALSEFLSQLPPIAIDDEASPEAPAVGVATAVSSKATAAAAAGLAGSSAAASNSSPRCSTRIRYSREELMRWKDATGADTVLDESYKGIPETLRAVKEAPRAKQHKTNGVVDSNQVQPDASAVVAVSADFGSGGLLGAEDIPGKLQPPLPAAAVPSACLDDDAQQLRRAYSRPEMLALRQTGNSSDADDAALQLMSPEVLCSVPEAIVVMHRRQISDK